MSVPVSAANAPPPQDAPAPFSTGADSFHATNPTDLILRSVDGFDFHVHKDVLQFASSCFKDMFVVSNGDAEHIVRDGKPVIVLTERMSVLHKLFCYAYPSRSSTQAQVDINYLDSDFVHIYRAADKYNFVYVEKMLEDVIHRYVQTPFLLCLNPYRLFAIGRILQLPALCKASVLSAVGSVQDPLTLSFPEMPLISWTDAQKLLRLVDQYRAGARAKLDTIFGAKAYQLSSTQPGKRFVWFLDEHSGSCSVNTQSEWGPCAEWFPLHVAKLRKTLSTSLPHQDVVTRAHIQELDSSHRAMINSCHQCSPLVTEQLKVLSDISAAALAQFHQAFEQQIDAHLAG
uniref:BTB domain-containing protein n=1 Tax=Mycena chlorophos TaxID=658473 RepID=A0ABQ0M1Q5_MYCCL|nr:predicted protein [Mycena chlorophos]